MTTETVEWGSERGRPNGMPRLPLTAPRRHAITIAGGLAVLGFALTLTAEVLPWLELKPTGAAPTRTEFPGEIDTSLRLTQLVPWQAPAYYIGVTALLTLTALALIGRPRARHGAAAAAVGTAAGQAVLLAGLLGTIREGNDFTGMLGRFGNGVFDFATGDGFYSAAAGLVLIAAAALAGWWGGAGSTKPTTADPETAAPRAGQPSAGEPGAAGAGERAGALDLTVAPAAPFQPGVS